MRHSLVKRSPVIWGTDMHELHEAYNDSKDPHLFTTQAGISEEDFYEEESAILLTRSFR